MSVKTQLSAIDQCVTSNANNIEQLKNALVESQTQLSDIKTQLESIHRDLMAQTNAILSKLKK
jgi:chromosome segregation ATPase